MLVIVHGLGRYAREWTGWAGDEAFVPDLPELRCTDSTPDFGRAISRLLSQLDDRGIARATWLGHSGGAHLALEIADRHPERIERLILVAAAPPRRVLEKVRCPVLVVLGALEGLTVDSMPGVQVEVLAGAGHDPHLEVPDQLRDRITRWSAVLARGR